MPGNLNSPSSSGNICQSTIRCVIIENLIPYLRKEDQGLDHEIIENLELSMTRFLKKNGRTTNDSCKSQKEESIDLKDCIETVKLGKNTKEEKEEMLVEAECTEEQEAFDTIQSPKYKRLRSERIPIYTTPDTMSYNCEGIIFRGHNEFVGGDLSNNSLKGGGILSPEVDICIKETMESIFE